MPVRPLARLFLITALVFSQTLYASHNLLHDTGSQADCQICLQAASGAALHCNDTGLQLIGRQPQQAAGTACASFPSQHGIAHPSRAPPSPAV
jgi:hypothetical protein